MRKPDFEKGMMILTGGKWKHLSFRLLFVVLATFLPLNLIVMTFSVMVWINFSEELVQSYERELQNGMTGFEDSIVELDESVDKLLMDHMSSLTVNGIDDEMAGFELIRNIHNVYEDEELYGMAYVYNRNSAQLYTKCTGVAYSPTELQKIQEDMYADFPLPYQSGWHLKEFGGRIFYYRSCKFTNYHIGLLLDIEESIENLYAEEYLQGKAFYIRGNESCCLLKDGELSWQTIEDWEKLGENRIGYQDAGWESQGMDFATCLRVQRGSFLSMIPIGYWLLLVVSVLLLFLVVLLWKMIKKRVIEPLQTLQFAMQSLQDGQREYRITQFEKDETIETTYIFNAFNQMAQEVQASYEKDIKMLQTQMTNLRLQVNPHMLLNSFNMIYSLAQLKNYECIQSFSLYLVDYFRYILKEADDMVPLSKEMKFVESYIGIQKIRFPGAFTSVYDMQEGAENALVPPLLIGNFVENAMKYALIPGETIEILINIRREGEKLLISICDTGCGMKEEVLQRVSNGEIYIDKMGNKHIGIWNCKRRMEVFYRERASFHIISARGEGTQIWMELPFWTKEDTGQ